MQSLQTNTSHPLLQTFILGSTKGLDLFFCLVGLFALSSLPSGVSSNGV